MRNFMIFVIISAALLAGCAKDCELRIYNDTPILQRAMIDGIVHDIQAGGEPAVETFYLNSYIILSETVKVDVEYIANSPISYRSPKKFKVEMKPGKDKTYRIKYDRGQIQLRNISFVDLDQVLLKKEGSDQWSEDLYEGILEPEEIDEIAVKAGNYTMKILDGFGTEYPLEEIEVIAGEQLQYFFDGQM